MRYLLQEIKRRNVFKVAFVYIVAGWVTMQIVDVMFPALKLPDWLTTAIAAMLLIGFPFAMIFAWAFEMTPEGIKREKDVDRSQSITSDTGGKLNKSAVIILAIAVGFLLFDKFFLQPETSAPADKPSIAVLPFVNMSDDADNEYFSDGLSEELLNVLAKIPQLHVAGRTSSFAFKGKTDDLRSIGEQLNVEHILEGSVRKSTTRLRITAQLIDTESGYHLWSETYDREVNDVFAVQDEISAAVVDALRVALLGEELTTDYGTDNVEAYNLFLKSRYLLDHTSSENMLAAIEAADGAIAIDPEYGNAYVLRAIAEIQMIGGWASDGSNFIEGNERVRAYAQKALAINPSSAEANFIKGVVAYTADWDYITAINFFERAIELDPRHGPAMGWYGNALSTLGRMDEAVIVYENALQNDPLSIALIRDLGDVHLFMKNYDEADRVYRTIFSLNQGIARVYGRLARLELIRGNIEAAEDYAEQEDIQWVREFILILALGRRGEMQEWRDRVDAYEKEYQELNAYQFAEIYADAGDADAAFKWLDVAAKVHDPGGLLLLADSLLEPLHDDPRWPQALKAFGHKD